MTSGHATSISALNLAWNFISQIQVVVSRGTPTSRDVNDSAKFSVELKSHDHAFREAKSRDLTPSGDTIKTPLRCGVK